MKKLIIMLLVMLTAVSSLSYAQFNKAGRTSLQFLKIGIGARQAGLGEAGIANISDINGVFWNPATIAGIEGTEAAFNYTKWIGDLYVTGGAAGINLPGIGTLAVNFISLDYGDIDEALVTGPSGGIDTRTGNSFTGNDLSFGVAFARYFTDRLSIGVNVKYIQEKLFIYSTSMWAFDVGSYYDTGWRGIKLAMAAQNFSSAARFLEGGIEEQQSYELPILFRIGASISLLGSEEYFLGGNPDEHRLALNIDAVHSNDYAERLHMGAEYWAFDILALRAGYRFNYEEGNFSAGIGFNYDAGPVNLKFDYAYVKYDFLDSPHRFSIIMNF
ncbi:MAG: PorV/PorQ family protein [Ignavibacteriaceae bacterium]